MASRVGAIRCSSVVRRSKESVLRRTDRAGAIKKVGFSRPTSHVNPTIEVSRSYKAILPSTQGRGGRFCRVLQPFLEVQVGQRPSRCLGLFLIAGGKSVARADPPVLRSPRRPG